MSFGVDFSGLIKANIAGIGDLWKFRQFYWFEIQIKVIV